MIGLYVGGIHAEVKRRPLYVIDKLTGFEQAIEAERRGSRTGADGTIDRRIA